MDLAFVICTEPAIEKQSKLLVRSIRKWVDETVPIYSFSPRNKELSYQTKKEFAKYGVEHETNNLNLKYNHFGNMPIATAYLERKTLITKLVFLDSDKVMFDWPDHLIDNDYDVAIRPEALIGIGIHNLETCVESKYWNELYKMVGKFPSRRVLTTADEAYIYEYFNSGLVAVKSSRGIFTAWETTYKEVVEKELYPQSSSYFTDQSTLAAVITAMVDNLLILPRTYNYPLTCHNTMIEPRRIHKLEDVVSIHYNDIFNKERWEDSINKLQINKKTDKFDWLVQNLKELHS